MTTQATPTQHSPAPNPAQEPDATETAMHRLLARNRARRSARRWIGFAAIPVLFVALVLVVKMLSMYVFAHQSIRAFVDLDFGRSASMASWQAPLNWFEQYKADYNLGTGLAELGQLDEARAALERALPLAPGLESCAVRYNLATVIERQGDHASLNGEDAAGQELYREALDILAAAHEGCADSVADEASPDRARSMPESLVELTRRIMEKLAQQSQNQNQGGGGRGEQPQPPEQQAPNDDQLDRLKEQLQDGAQERQEREQNQQQDGFGGGTDRPW